MGAHYNFGSLFTPSSLFPLYSRSPPSSLFTHALLPLLSHFCLLPPSHLPQHPLLPSFSPSLFSSFYILLPSHPHFRLSGDIQDFKSSFKMAVSQGLRSLTQTLGCVVSLYLISPQMTALVGVALPVMITVGTMFGAVLRQWSRQAQEQASSPCVCMCVDFIPTSRKEAPLYVL